MQVTQVSVSWKETRSLPGYNNISTSLELTASVAPEEHHEFVKQELLEACKEFCRTEIDNALEENGQPPEYDTESPRYVLYQIYRDRKSHPVVIVPVSVSEDAPGLWMRVSHLYDYELQLSKKGVRLEAARKFARQVEASEVIEILDLDDLEKLETIASPNEEEPPF